MRGRLPAAMIKGRNCIFAAKKKRVSSTKMSEKACLKRERKKKKKSEREKPWCAVYKLLALTWPELGQSYLSSLTIPQLPHNDYYIEYGYSGTCVVRGPPNGSSRTQQSLALQKMKQTNLHPQERKFALLGKDTPSVASFQAQLRGIKR